MKSKNLTKEQQEVIDSTYAKPLKELTDLLLLHKTLTPEQQNQGLDLVTRYYTYLDQCGIPYGKTALDIINNRDFVGIMTNLHLERQAQFEGINNIQEIKPLLTIDLVQRDAHLSSSNSTETKVNLSLLNGERIASPLRCKML